ncbi:MAG: hypothetical protein IPI67_21645 [Myxococcales bacterium]|nr:hypothetical protein [Myxococcales bacterium]
MRRLAFVLAAAAFVYALPAAAEEAAAQPKAPGTAAPAADKPVEEAEAPKESPLPFAMFMSGAGVGTAAVGAYLAFATDDLGSKRLGVPLMIAGGLSAAAGVTLIVLSSKEPAKVGRAPRPVHTLSLGPTSAAYSFHF